MFYYVLIIAYCCLAVPDSCLVMYVCMYVLNCVCVCVCLFVCLRTYDASVSQFASFIIFS